MLVIYIFIKLVLYILVCSAAVPMLNLKVDDRSSFAIKWGVIRFFIGLLAGFLIVLILAILTKAIANGIIVYVLSFGLVRYLEWLLLVYFISKKQEVTYGSKTQRFIIFGVLVSTLIDGIVYYFDMLGNLKFFC